MGHLVGWNPAAMPPKAATPQPQQQQLHSLHYPSINCFIMQRVCLSGLLYVFKLTLTVPRIVLTPLDASPYYC